jgi:hypothetical protein
MIMLGNFFPSKTIIRIFSIAFSISMAVMFAMLLMVVLNMMLVFYSLDWLYRRYTLITLNRLRRCWYWFSLALQFTAYLCILVVTLVRVGLSLSFFSHQDINQSIQKRTQSFRYKVNYQFSSFICEYFKGLSLLIPLRSLQLIILLYYC